MTDQVHARLSQIKGIEIQKPDYAATGATFDVLVEAGSVREFAKALRELEFMIESVTAVDANPMMIIYHLTRVDMLCRVAGRVLIDRENPVCPSIQDIYPGANWHERETHDFFGVVFSGHPDLTPLILPEDSGDLRPLRKKPEALKALGDVVPRFKAAPAKTDDLAEVEK